MLRSLLVHIGRGIVPGLVDLVFDSTLGSARTGADRGVVVLDDPLVGLLGSGVRGTCIALC
jgi:hypothetical protein